MTRMAIPLEQKRIGGLTCNRLRILKDALVLGGQGVMLGKEV